MTAGASQHRISRATAVPPAPREGVAPAHDAELLRRCGAVRGAVLRGLAGLGVRGLDAEAVYWAAVDGVARAARPTPDDRALRALLMATARNLGVTLIRRESAHRRALRRLAGVRPAPSGAGDAAPDALLWCEYRDRLPGAMSHLDETERRILEVLVVRQLTTRRAASEACLPESTLRKRFQSILNKLACQLTSAPGPGSGSRTAFTRSPGHPIASQRSSS